MTHPDPLGTVLAYHERTKHHLHRYAAALGYMDWDTQPDPFRRYEGAPLLRLDEVEPTTTPGYARLFDPRLNDPRRVDRASISQLFYDSLALSAWKQFKQSRWSLRANPSSGNLHPTEAYLLAGPIDGLTGAPGLFHYASFEHGLEQRATLSTDEWRDLTRGLPPGSVLVGLTSIYWRESWKYGERAFRYCMHDVGHAIAAVALAASALGWEARLLERPTDDELGALLGVGEQVGPEAEHPDCLMVLNPDAIPIEQQKQYRPDRRLIARLAAASRAGSPNQLSMDHHDWPVIDAVSEAARRGGAPEEWFWAQAGSPGPCDPAGDSAVSGRRIIRQRRSAVAMDGRSRISAETFLGMMQRLMPPANPAPFAALPWRPCVALGIFVHRVEGLKPGLYALVRDSEQFGPLHAALGGDFAWERPRDCPLDLFLLRAADCRGVAKTVSCHQDIAADGAFALGMLAHYEPALRRFGPRFYKRLHWETGVIGQVLYLEAEAAAERFAGLRSTGIGCFFDDAMHEVLGITTRDWQTLYHFTVGGAVEDSRLQTAPAYAHLER